MNLAGMSFDAIYTVCWRGQDNVYSTGGTWLGQRELKSQVPRG